METTLFGCLLQPGFLILLSILCCNRCDQTTRPIPDKSTCKGVTDQISDFQTDKSAKQRFLNLTGVLPGAVLTEVLRGGVKMESAPSEAVVSQLDNPAWPKVSHEARTELNVYRGNRMRKA
jgi:hypothetical protein